MHNLTYIYSSFASFLFYYYSTDTSPEDTLVQSIALIYLHFCFWLLDSVLTIVHFQFQVSTRQQLRRCSLRNEPRCLPSSPPTTTTNSAFDSSFKFIKHATNCPGSPSLCASYKDRYPQWTSSSLYPATSPPHSLVRHSIAPPSLPDSRLCTQRVFWKWSLFRARPQLQLLHAVPGFVWPVFPTHKPLRLLRAQ